MLTSIACRLGTHLIAARFNFVSCRKSSSLNVLVFERPFGVVKFNAITV